MPPSKTRWQDIQEIWRDYTLQYRFFILIVLVLVGFWLFGNNTLNLFDNMLGYTINVFTEGLSIAVTVLIIDFLNRAREKRDQADLQKRLDEQELTRLKALLGSNEAVVTKIAIAELKAKGWLYDGSLHSTNLEQTNLKGTYLVASSLIEVILDESNLQMANLNYANLEKATLAHADLQETSMNHSNLEKTMLLEAKLYEADLSRSTLRNSYLYKANLKNAILRETNLEEADLRYCNLSGTDLSYAIVKNTNFFGATLPDGKKWSEDVDMGCFTNPKHPEFKSTLVKIKEIRKEVI